MTSVWSEHFTKEGRAYYYNRKTKQSAWEKPADFDGESASDESSKPAAAATTNTSRNGTEWEELWDPKNERHYYYDRANRKTQWQRPEGVEIKPHAGATTATKKESKSKKTHSTTATDAEKQTESNNKGANDKANTVASIEAGGKKEEAPDAVTAKVKDNEDDRATRAKDSHRHTPTKKAATSVSPKKRNGAKAEAAGESSASVGAAPVHTAHQAKRSIVVDDEEDGDGDLVDGADELGEEEEEEEDGDDEVQERKRKKKLRTENHNERHARKRVRADNHNEQRMIICDDEDNMTREANKEIHEKDTAEGKEATRLLQELSKPDAILEENVLDLINGFLRAHNESDGPEILVEKLSSSYRGHAQMVGLVASWLDALPVSKTALEHKYASFDVAEGVVPKDKGPSWDPASDILYSYLQEAITQHYEPKMLSDVLSGSATEPEWLTQMLSDRKWRRMLIELAETHKTCSLLQYAIRHISAAGHHKEIASMASANAFFSVFNGILLDAFCRIPFASDEEARDDLSALKKICCQSAYSFVYAEELLCAIDNKLFILQEDPATRAAHRTHYRTVRSKLSRVRFELQETTTEKYGAKIEAVHPLRRRYLYDSNHRLSDAILSIVKTKNCTEAAADALAKEYKTPGSAPPVGLLRDPLVFKTLLDPLFNPAVALSPTFAQNCIHLLAYAACAKDERSILQANAADRSTKAGATLDQSELEAAKAALQEASALCRDDHTLSFNMNQTGVVEKLGAAMGVSLASVGVLHWIEVTLKSPAFFNSSLLHICFPSLLRILKTSIRLHVSQWPIAFRVLVTSLHLHPDVNPVKALELKRESLRSMAFMITSGYVLPVLEFVFTNTAELDQALLRNFIMMLFAQIAPPYSVKFVVAMTKILTHPKVQNAIKSCPPECKTKLQGFTSYCKKNTGVLSSDQLQALVFSMEGL